MKEIFFLLAALMFTGLIAQSSGYDFYRVQTSAEPDINQSETVVMSHCGDLQTSLKNQECGEADHLIVKPQRTAITVVAGFLFGGWLAAWYRRKWKGEFP